MNRMTLLLSPENANDLVSTIENALGKGDDVSRRSIESTLRFMQTGGMCSCGCMYVRVHQFICVAGSRADQKHKPSDKSDIGKQRRFIFL